MKRRQAALKGKQTKAKQVKRQETKLDWDEEIESSEDGDYSDRSGEKEDEEEEEVDEETAEQKRKRLAKDYLASMGGVGNESSSDDEDGDEYDRVGARLEKERLITKGKFYRTLADSFTEEEEEYKITYLNGHKLSVTAIALTQDNRFIYSGSKDNSVIAWDVETGSKQILLPAWNRHSAPADGKGSHSGDCEVLAVAVSSDGRYAVSGGRDNEIKVFDIRNKSALVQSMKGHRDAVTSLAFRKDSLTLYSGSYDRCIKHWEIGDMAYMETLFGHQDKVLSLDCWNKDRPVTSSTDRSIRVWSVADDSHAVFRGHKASIDAVQILTEDSFVSGGEDGSISLWRDSLKKPVVTAAAAHCGAEASAEASVGGASVGASAASVGVGKPNWVCSLAAVKMSDLVFSGSHDGRIGVWKAQVESKCIQRVSSIPCAGFVNALAVSSIDPTLLVAGLGREHKFGRWWNLKGNKDKIAIIQLPKFD